MQQMRRKYQSFRYSTILLQLHKEEIKMSNEEWQEMIRKNIAKNTVLSPAIIKIEKDEKEKNKEEK